MSDFKVKLDAARQRLPLKRLMEQRGRAPSNGNWKSFPRCPYCGKDGAGVFPARSGDRFKCHHSNCPSGTQEANSAWDEIGFLAHELGLSREEAGKIYLKEAGVWEDRERLPPSVMPGKSGRRLPEPSRASAVDEDLIRQYIEVIRSEKRASVSLLQCRLHLGYTRAAEIMDELQRRGVVGPAKGAEPRDILNLPPSESAPQTSSGAAEPSHPHSRQTVVSREGEAGQKTSSESYSKDADGGAAVPDAPPAADCVSASPAGPPTEPRAGEAPPLPAEAGNPAAASPATKGAEAPPPENLPDRPGPEPEAPPPMLALRWFYTRLHLTDADRDALWKDRGLHAGTVAALGYRSNPKSNKELLLQVAQHFPVPVLVESGLWSEAEKPTAKPKPNPQFYGMSLVEKRDAEGRKVKNDEGHTVLECLWNEPVLIPYFDERGELVHLRPHKGMMKDKAPRFYVARACKEWLPQLPPRPQPQFAVVTEGEFKAAALWQTLSEATVGSLPGITMAKPLFGDVEEWVDVSGTRRAVIAYDTEEKGDPNLPGFKRPVPPRHSPAANASDAAALCLASVRKDCRNRFRLGSGPSKHLREQLT